MLRIATFVTLLALGCGVVGSVMAEAREWPGEMSLGGFAISGIRGGSNADGSGSASGTLILPVANNPRISLNRTSRGDVSGNLSLTARTAGYEVQGSFSLDSSGMRGRGMVRTPARPISDASFAVEPGGQFNGTGRMDLGAGGIPVRFSIGPGRVSVNGSGQVQSQADTPLATYVFAGTLQIDGGGGSISLSAKGTIRRTGKLTNQVTNSQASMSVDPNTGVGRANVDGVNIAFDFFKR